MKKLLFYLATIPAVWAQEHIPVPLADPGRPVVLSIHLVNGSVTVRAYNGREVIVDTKGGSSGSPETRDGLHRISGAGSDISIESDNNKVSITSHGGRGGDLTVQTPVNTSLNVKTINNGEVVIEGVSGEIEAQALNGGVVMNNVSGSVVAHSLNGSVKVSMATVKSGSPMSFTSLNGAIDVTLPANVAADFSMKTTHGDIYSDFDVKLKAPRGPVVEESDSKKGKYKVKTDSAVVGSVNGGGPEYQFQTLNGSIFIRKAK